MSLLLLVKTISSDGDELGTVADAAVHVMAAPSGGDDTAAISAAMDAANAAGKVLLFRCGRWKSTHIDKTYAPRIIGLPGAVIEITNTSSWCWRFTGSLGSAANLTGNAAKGARILAVDTTGISAGDLIIVGEATAIWTADSSTKYVGQQVEVVSVDSAAQLTIAEPLYRAFTTAATAFVKKVTPIVGLTIDGLRFEHTTTSGVTSGFIRVSYGRRVKIDITGYLASAAGIRLISCFDFDVRSIAHKYAWNSGASQFGYGVETMSACANGTVHSDAYYGANAFTTSTEAGTHGEPNNLRVTGQNVGSASIGFGTHPAGNNIVFHDIQVVGATGNGMEIRNLGTTVQGARIVDSGVQGIYGYEAIGRLRILGTQIVRTNQVSVGNGIKILAVDDMLIQGCHIEDSGYNGIEFVSTATDVRVLNNEFCRYGVVQGTGSRGVRFAGLMTRVRIHGNTAIDDAGTRTSGDFLNVFNGANTDVTYANQVCCNGIPLIGAVTTGVTQANNNAI